MAMTDTQVDEMVNKLRVAFGVETTDDLIRKMVNRFLCWKLAKDFAPDAGVSFTPLGDYDSYHWPTGTNLFHAGQAEEMVRHMLGVPNKI